VHIVQVTKPNAEPSAEVHFENWFAQRGVKTESRRTMKGPALFRVMEEAEYQAFKALKDVREKSAIKEPA